MKIIYLTSYGSNFPSRDANSIHIMRMCEAISKLGHEVILLISDKGKSISEVFSYYGIEEIFRIEIIKVPTIKTKTLLYSIKAGYVTQKLKPDIVLGRSAQGCALATSVGISTIYDSHGPVWEISWIEAFAYKLLYKNKNLIKMTTNSLALKSLYEQNGLLPHCGIIVAHNGSLVLPLKEKPDKWPGRTGALKVGYIGHLYPGRGIEIILECARKLPDVDFHIIGGNEEDIDYWEIRSNNDNLYFHGFVRHSEVYLYRNNCDVLLAPYGDKNVSMAGGGGDQSRYMNPIKIIEYMSSRKAIICSDIPVLREILDDNSAVFVNPVNISDWVNAIKKLQNNDFRNNLAAQAYEKFLNNLTWEKRALRMLP